MRDLLGRLLSQEEVDDIVQSMLEEDKDMHEITLVDDYEVSIRTRIKELGKAIKLEPDLFKVKQYAMEAMLQCDMLLRLRNFSRTERNKKYVCSGDFESGYQI